MTSFDLFSQFSAPKKSSTIIVSSRARAIISRAISARAISQNVATLNALLNLVPRVSHLISGNEVVLCFRDKPGF